MWCLEPDMQLRCRHTGCPGQTAEGGGVAIGRVKLLSSHRMALGAGCLCEILTLTCVTLRLRSGAVGHQNQPGNDQGADILHVVPAFSRIFQLYRKQRLALAQTGEIP